MAEHEVEVVELEALPSCIHPLDDVLAGETALVGTLATPEDLRGDHILVAPPAKLPAYASALSKKLQPASKAAAMASRAGPTSIWWSNVTHAPNDRAETLSPE